MSQAKLADKLLDDVEERLQTFQQTPHVYFRHTMRVVRVMPGWHIEKDFRLLRDSLNLRDITLRRGGRFPPISQPATSLTFARAMARQLGRLMTDGRRGAAIDLVQQSRSGDEGAPPASSRASATPSASNEAAAAPPGSVASGGSEIRFGPSGGGFGAASGSRTPLAMLGQGEHSGYVRLGRRVSIAPLRN